MPNLAAPETVGKTVICNFEARRHPHLFCSGGWRRVGLGMSGITRPGAFGAVESPVITLVMPDHTHGSIEIRGGVTLQSLDWDDWSRWGELPRHHNPKDQVSFILGRARDRLITLSSRGMERELGYLNKMEGAVAEPCDGEDGGNSRLVDIWW